MKFLAHIITIGGLILYLIAKHESNKPTKSAEKSPAMDLSAESEKDTQPQTSNSAVESTNTVGTVHSTANSNIQQTSSTPEEQEKAKKRTRWKVWLCAAAALGIFFYVKFGAPAATYQRSLRLIEERNYEKAADILLDIAPEYKDSLWLWDYAHTRAKYGESPSGEAAIKAYESLDGVVKYGKQLDCYEEICQYADKVKAAADKQIAINEKNAETERQQHRLNAQSGIPYIGMPEEFINSTTLGQCYSSYRSDGYASGRTNTYYSNCTKYDWYIYTPTFHAAVFSAWAKDGQVVDIEKLNLQYWNGNKVLGEFMRPSNANNYSGSHSYSASDPYDAGAYSSADDFYYDYYNDFFDYEEAEEYWYEHN